MEKKSLKLTIRKVRNYSISSLFHSYLKVRISISVYPITRCAIVCNVHVCFVIGKQRSTRRCI